MTGGGAVGDTVSSSFRRLTSSGIAETAQALAARLRTFPLHAFVTSNGFFLLCVREDKVYDTVDDTGHTSDFFPFDLVT